MLRNKTNPKQAIILALDEDDYEVLRTLWLSYSIRQGFGMFTFTTVTVLNQDTPEVETLQKAYPTLIGYIKCNKVGGADE